jgi:general secretion pathway protein A
MNAQNAVLLAGGAEHAVSLISLARFWHGEFATYWQPPPGYQSDLRAGPAGPHWSQLSRQLAQLEGRAVPEDDGMLLPDAALVARVRAFQAGQGIKPDGHAGPMTFMQLEKALGSKGPSLQAGAH